MSGLAPEVEEQEREKEGGYSLSGPPAGMTFI